MMESKPSSREDTEAVVEEKGINFENSLQELRELRAQLHHAADYCETTFLKSKEKTLVVENTKEYICRAVVTVVDHLGNVSANLECLISQNNAFSEAELRINSLKQRLLSCDQYAHKLALANMRWSENLPRFHSRYLSSPPTLERLSSSEKLRDSENKVVDPKIKDKHVVETKEQGFAAEKIKSTTLTIAEVRHSALELSNGVLLRLPVMGDDKSSIVMANRDKDRELLLPVADAGHEDAASKPSSSSSSSHHTGREPFRKLIGVHLTWIKTIFCYLKLCFAKMIAAVKFSLLSVILFPIAITFYITWWFIHFVDGFFSPIYAQLGIDIFGLGFVTSITFIFLVGVFMSSWLGASVLGLGEWFIKRMPLVRHIYNASKQISAAISPDQNTQAFKEVAIIRHPRVGEYAFGFITSSVVLQYRGILGKGEGYLRRMITYSGEEELCCVYVPTNHLYIGDIFLVNTKDVIRPNLSVREGIEIVVSGGMSMPQILSTLDSSIMSVDRIRPERS
ncbi:protein LIKE COV 1-like [Senna tora]|uniref:Protein LIKE COV 1-like n=1 Tax=Senna tora TaxID=362788 RepID=A0A834TEH0_9FABA|nr:protein LIKE COV 1-like [Senna tora]